MTTTTIIDTIPEPWRQALQDCNGDGTVLGALADYCEEEGDPVAADCLRWAMEKGRWAYENRVDYGVWWQLHKSTPLRRASGELPPLLMSHVMNEVYREYEADNVDTWTILSKGYSVSVGFSRLIRGWRQSTEQERKVYWQWQPQKS